jgi:Zn-dependent protease
MSFDVAAAALWILPLLLAVVCHEVSHGWVAYKLGDPTAAMLGRLTLNPIPHIDPIGTVLLPGLLLVTGSPFLFGYAKPVPISVRNLRNPARDAVYVAAAGPVTNFLLAVASALLLALLVRTVDLGGAGGEPQGFAVAGPVAEMAYRSIVVNVVLAVFNLLPIPPLDGGRVAVGLLPGELGRMLAQVEPFGFLIVFALVMTGFLGQIIGPIVGAILSLLRGLI